MTLSHHSHHLYKAAVIGAGPAGLAVVARLLDTHNTPIIWIDPCFQGGRLQRYPHVPSNTKVKLFIKFAQVSPALCNAASHPNPNPNPNQVNSYPLDTLKSMNPDQGCDLIHAQQLTACLGYNLTCVYSQTLTPMLAWVSHIDYSQQLDHYSLTLHPNVVDTFDTNPVICDSITNSTTLLASDIYMCTGSEPIPMPLSIPTATRENHSSPPHLLSPHPITVLDLDTCLNPIALTDMIKNSSSPMRVAVVGSSHSAILCLMNLTTLHIPVVNFYRHPLKYAQEMNDGEWILYDNTGLKGQAAIWSKQYLHDPIVSQSIGIQRVQLPLTNVQDELNVYKQYWASVDQSPITHIVYAIGYRSRPLPKLSINHHPFASQGVIHDPHSGLLKCAVTETPLPRARGFGIAFPELITDPQGNVESSVGMWKFQRYVRQVLNG